MAGELNDLELRIVHKIEGGLDLRRTTEDVRNLGNEANTASEKVNKLSESQRRGSSTSSSTQTADLQAQIGKLEKQIQLIERRNELIGRRPAERTGIRGQQEIERFGSEGADRIAQSTLLAAERQTHQEIQRILEQGARTRESISQRNAATEMRALEQIRAQQQKVFDAAMRGEQGERAEIERTISALEKKARFSGLNSPAQRAAAVGQQASIDLAHLGSAGASAQEIERAAAAYAKLKETAASAEIPLRQLSPVIGYQGAQLLNLGSSIKDFAAGLSPTTLLIGGLTAAVAGISVATLVGANNLGNYARSMKNLSEETGLSIQGAQVFSRVTDVMGLRAQAIVPGIQRMYMALAEGGEQSKKSAEAFGMLGIYARDVTTGALKPMDELLPKVFESLKNMKDEATANAVAHALFGRSFNQLIPAIKEYEETARRVKETGVIIDPETMRQADEFHTKIALLKDDWNSLVLALEKKAIGVVDILVPGGLEKPPAAQYKPGVQQYLPSWLANQYKSSPEYGSMAADTLNLPKFNDPSGGAAALAARLDEREKGNANKKTSEDLLSKIAVMQGTTPSEGLLAAAKLKSTAAQEKIKEHERNSTDPTADKQKALDAAAEVRALEDRVKSEREYQTLLKENKRLQVEAAQSGLDGLDKMIAKHREELDQVKKFPDIYKERKKLFGEMEVGELGRESNKAAGIFQREKMESDVKSISDRAETLKRSLDLSAKVRDSAQKLIDPDSKHDFGADRSAAVQGFGVQSQAADQRFEREMQYADSLTLEKDRLKAVEEAEKHRSEGASKAAKEFIDNILKTAAAQKEADITEQKRSEDTDKRIRELQANYGVQAIRRQAATQISQLNNAAVPGDERHVAAQDFAIRLEAEARIAEERIKPLAAEKDHDKQREEAAKILGEMTADRAQLEFQYAERIAALRKQEQDRSRNVAGGLFGALTDSRGPGAGLNSFLRSETMGMEKTMFENVLGPIINNSRNSLSTLIPGQRDGGGNLTGIGKIFAGTALGDKGADVATQQVNSTKDLVGSNVSLKTSIDTLTQIMSGSGPASTVTITGAGSNTTIIPGLGSSTTSGVQVPGFGGGSAISIPGLGQPSWMQALLGIGGAAATTVGGLAAAGIFNQSGFSIAKREPTVSQADGGNNAHNSLVTSSGPGINIPQAAIASFLGGVSLLGAIGKIVPPGTDNGLSQFFTGLTKGTGLGFAGLRGAITGSDYTVQTGPGQYATASSLGYTSPSARAGTIIADTAGVVGGAFQAYQGFKQGGGKGALAGVSAIAGTAAMFDPTGISAAVAVAAGIVGAMLGDPKQQYANLVQKRLETDRYLAPPTLNETVSTGGYDVNYDKYGRARQIPFQGLSSSLPFLQKDPFNSNSWLTVPGQVFQPSTAGGPVAMPPNVNPGTSYPGFVPAGSGTNINITVHALDAQSVMNRSHDIGAAVHAELLKGGALAQRIQSTILGS